MIKVLYIPTGTFLSFLLSGSVKLNTRTLDFEESIVHHSYFPEAIEYVKYLCSHNRQDNFKINNNLPTSLFIEEFEVINE